MLDAIQTSRQNDILDTIHSGYQDNQMLRLHKMFSVVGCLYCEGRKAKQREREPLKPNHLADVLFQMGRVDFCKLKRQDYLMLKDYFTRYINIGQFANINTASVIEYLNNIFAHQGIPITFVSNNNQQFVLIEFKEYADAWSFSHVISRLCIPQANGEIVNQKN